LGDFSSLEQVENASKSLVGEDSHSSVSLLFSFPCSVHHTGGVLVTRAISAIIDILRVVGDVACPLELTEKQRELTAHVSCVNRCFDALMAVEN